MPMWSTGVAEGDEVAGPRLRRAAPVGPARAWSRLTRGSVDAEVAVDALHEPGAVEAGRRVGAAPPVGHAEVALGGGDDVAARDGAAARRPLAAAVAAAGAAGAALRDRSQRRVAAGRAVPPKRACRTSCWSAATRETAGPGGRSPRPPPVARRWSTSSTRRCSSRSTSARARRARWRSSSRSSARTRAAAARHPLRSVRAAISAAHQPCPSVTRTCGARRWPLACCAASSAVSTSLPAPRRRSSAARARCSSARARVGGALRLAQRRRGALLLDGAHAQHRRQPEPVALHAATTACRSAAQPPPRPDGVVRCPGAGTPSIAGLQRHRPVDQRVGAGDVGPDLDEVARVAVGGQQPAQLGRRSPAAPAW